MATPKYNTYVGMRYVPIFDGEWDRTKTYEPLTIVSYQGNSYTSKTFVPTGIDVTNTQYWALTGNYNAQVEYYRQETARVSEQLDSRIKAFNTINEMKNDTTLLADMVCKTLGGISTNDGGGAFYKITDVEPTEYHETLMNNLYATLACEKFVTPQVFGAVGDGSTDCTQSLQNCFSYAYNHKLDVFIPSGEYCFSSLTIEGASFSETTYIPNIVGNDRDTTILKHTGTGVAVHVIPYGEESYINGINISGIHVKGHNGTTVGIEIESGTKINIDNVNVTTCSTAGIQQTHNFWMSNLTNIYVGDCGIGLNVTGNSVTSIKYDHIYVVNATNEAFYISSGYSEIGTLAADRCSGVHAYNLVSFSGSIGSLACEACDVESIFKFSGSQCNIGILSVWSPVLDGTMVTPIEINESRINIECVRINGAETLTSELPFCKLSYSRCNVDYLYGNYNFAKPQNSQSGHHSVITVNGVNVRTNSNRAYLGNDRSMGDSLFHAPFGKADMGVAIYTDCTHTPAFLGDGTDVRWTTPVKNGDWFIENNPATYGVAAYVIMEDYSGEVSNAKRGTIPILLSGPTSGRPTTFPVGGIYFDMTLGKPIFYKGTGNTNWVDATGTFV